MSVFTVSIIVPIVDMAALFYIIVDYLHWATRELLMSMVVIGRMTRMVRYSSINMMTVSKS